MKILRQSGVILIILLIGELISKHFELFIPGSIIGMVLLLIILNLKIIDISFFKESSDFLLSHLAFFFIPPGVALINALPLLKESWLAIVLISVITTFIVMSVTGLFLEKMIKEKK